VRGRRPHALLALICCLATASIASAQAFTYRGFVDVRGVLYPQDAPHDARNTIADLVARQEAFFTAAEWLRFAAGLELRASSYNQVAYSWEVDVADRTARRPAISLRRLTATLTHGPLTVDVGKQFVRWGKTDIVTPTDRFAPRDFLNVFDAELLGVRGVRAVVETGGHTVDAVWLPEFTPSRLPLPDQRWSILPPFGVAVRFAGAGAEPPDRRQVGLRWSHIGQEYEFSVSVFDGFNHLPAFSVESGFPPTLRRTHAPVRTYGGDLALPTRWATIKGEAAYFATAAGDTDEYVLYVVQLERQRGEWLFVGGYAGEHVTTRRAVLSFAPDRGFARSIVARGTYTIDANLSVGVEAAVRQNGDGVYAKGEFSQAHGAHWRMTISGSVIRGESDDFLGQYRWNSHVGIGVRYSF
jgi:hypothetical protein